MSSKIITGALALLLAAMSINVVASFKVAAKMDQLYSLIDAQTFGEHSQIPGGDNPVLGEEDAKVTMIEFSDFQCPYCAAFHQQVFPQINEQYIKTGKVKFVMRDFPLPFHKSAMAAAIAAECAQDQNKYWEYAEAIFSHQDKLDAESLIDYAKSIGMNEDEFSKCLAINQGADIDKDIADGKRHGVTGTPAFFINDRLIEGMQPFSAFAQVIDEELVQ